MHQGPTWHPARSALRVQLHTPRRTHPHHLHTSPQTACDTGKHMYTIHTNGGRLSAAGFWRSLCSCASADWGLSFSLSGAGDGTRARVNPRPLLELQLHAPPPCSQTPSCPRSHLKPSSVKTTASVGSTNRSGLSCCLTSCGKHTTDDQRAWVSALGRAGQDRTGPISWPKHAHTQLPTAGGLFNVVCVCVCVCAPSRMNEVAY